MDQPKLIGVTKPRILHTNLRCCICHQHLHTCDKSWAVLLLASSNRDARLLINTFQFGAYHQNDFVPQHRELVTGIGNTILWLLGKPHILLVACKQNYRPLAQLAVDLEDLASCERDSLMESIAYSRDELHLLN